MLLMFSVHLQKCLMIILSRDTKTAFEINTVIAFGDKMRRIATKCPGIATLCPLRLVYRHDIIVVDKGAGKSNCFLFFCAKDNK